MTGKGKAEDGRVKRMGEESELLCLIDFWFHGHSLRYIGMPVRRHPVTGLYRQSTPLLPPFT